LSAATVGDDQALLFSFPAIFKRAPASSFGSGIKYAA